MWRRNRARASASAYRGKRRALAWESFDALEGRELMASAIPGSGAGLGAFLPPLHVFTPPGLTAPRVVQPGLSVDPHRAINRTLTTVLGPGTARVTRAVELFNASERSTVAEAVLANPFVQGVFRRNDVYSALNNAAVRGSLSFGSSPSQDAEVVIVEPPSTIGDILPDGSREVFISSGAGTGIRITIDGSIPIVENGNGTRVVRVARSELPPEAQNLLSGVSARSQIFSGIGDDILLALETAKPTIAPEAADSVPGLRQYSQLRFGKVFPELGKTPFVRYLRLAIDKGLFRLSATQMELVNDRLEQFFNTANDLYVNGAFNTPDQSEVVPPSAPLNGTLAVSYGALRQFFLDERTNIDGIASVSGLRLPTLAELPGVSGFAGRYDLGFVFDRQGNFGLIVTLRNVLENTIPGLQDANKVMGELAVEVSNARNINQLNGARGVEGLSLGSALSGSVLASSGNGVSTFKASVGYGAGIEFGVGASLTQVIPLGNVLAPRFR